MGIVGVALSMSLDGLITGPDPGETQPPGALFARDRNVHLMGGASTVDQAPRLGLVDELNLHIEPVLPGAGARLLADIGGPVTLERTSVGEGPRSTHVRYRVPR
ncbi:dihydrofolate reductase family protein [Actinophytocola sp.]|uniref:dihydrofolate reductase family protein n=1 Tax=Actinophytocola sp. TaxID=1872138 RepID=UPI0025B7F838|nr:dihydrofolate reductase family protein [Actinophytocola sp.]